MTVNFDANAYLRQFQDQEHALVMLDRALGIFRKYLPDLAKEEAARGVPSLRTLINNGGTNFGLRIPTTVSTEYSKQKPKTVVSNDEDRALRKQRRKEHHELMQKQAHDAAIKRKDRRKAAHELRVKEQMEAKVKRSVKKQLEITKREAMKLKSPKSELPRRKTLETEFRSKRELNLGTIKKLVDTYSKKRYSCDPKKKSDDDKLMRETFEMASTFVSKLPVMCAFKSHTRREVPVLVSKAKYLALISRCSDSTMKEDCTNLYTSLKSVIDLYNTYNGKFAELFWETGRNLNKDSIKSQKKALKER